MIVTLDKNNIVIAISQVVENADQFGTLNDSMMNDTFPEFLLDGTSANLDTYKSKVIHYTYLNTELNSYKNDPEIGYTYNNVLNAFIPPQPDPTYILDQENFVWNPNPELAYDIHGDGTLYKWNPNGWTLTS